MKKYHVVVIGGGISGLSTAFFLSRRAAQENLSLRITVLEASDRFGGVLRTLTRGELRMEAGADAFYAGQNDALELCRELGLQEEVIEAAPCFRHFFSLKNNKPFPLPGFPRSLPEVLRSLNSPQLSLAAKYRMLGEPFIPRRKEEGDESLASFVLRRLGDDFYREIAKPLVQGVYMMDPELLSLEALFPKLREAEKTYGSLAGSFLRKKSRKRDKSPAEFFTLKHGLEGLVLALVRSLGACELRKSTPVRQCAYDKGWAVSLEDGEVLRADALILAMNACDSANLLSVAAPELSRELSDIHYDSIATVNLMYQAGDVPVRGLVPGFLVPMEGAEYPFSSLKWLGKSLDGKYVLMRTFLSETMAPEIFHESDAMLKQRTLDFLGDRLGVHGSPLSMSVERYPHALPQYAVGHLEHVAWVEKMALQYPGLFLIGNGFHGFGITDCMRQARIAASGLRFS